MFVITIQGLGPLHRGGGWHPQNFLRLTARERALSDLNHIPQERKLDQTSSPARLQHLEQCLHAVGIQQLFAEFINWVFGENSWTLPTLSQFSQFLENVFSVLTVHGKTTKPTWAWRTAGLPLSLGEHIPCWGDINPMRHKTSHEVVAAPGKTLDAQWLDFFFFCWFSDWPGKSRLSAPQFYLLQRRRNADYGSPWNF